MVRPRRSVQGRLQPAGVAFRVACGRAFIGGKELEGGEPPFAEPSYAGQRSINLHTSKGNGARRFLPLVLSDQPPIPLPICETNRSRAIIAASSSSASAFSRATFPRSLATER